MEKIQERLLGAQEILFYVMNEASPKHFLMAVEIASNTTKDAWKKAVADLQNAHPLLTMSIVMDGDSLRFAASNQSLLLDMTELIQPLNLKEAIEEELEKGFQSDKGPLARVKLLHSEQKCVVIIAAHHSISDALSSVSLLDDLLGLLSGKSIDQLPLQQSVDEWLGFANNGLAAKINQQIKPGCALPHEFLKQHPPAKVDIINFSKDFTGLLAQCAKAQRTTVHGALQAAAALSLKELAFEAGRPAYIMSPFSVRSEMNIGTDCGLFIDTKIVAVTTDEAMGFWNIAREAKDGLSDVHTAEFLKSSAEQLRGLIGYSDDLLQFIKDNFNFDVMLSNLGRLSFSNADAGLKVNYVIGPFIISGFNSQQAIGATTWDGKLVLTNSSRYLVSGLLNMMKAKLEQACEQVVQFNNEVDQYIS